MNDFKIIEDRINIGIYIRQSCNAVIDFINDNEQYKTINVKYENGDMDSFSSIEDFYKDHVNRIKNASSIKKVFYAPF